VAIVIGPVVAPAGTSTNTDCHVGILKSAAGVPLNVTDVAPSRLSPHSSTVVPTAPVSGDTSLTFGLGGARPTFSENTVPAPVPPPFGDTP